MLTRSLVGYTEESAALEDDSATWAAGEAVAVGHIDTSSIESAVREISLELSGLHRDIAEQAVEHIHANEIILTFGRSRTVERFLTRAAKRRHFSVIVVESAPIGDGRAMAAALGKVPGIDTTLISDADVFALMARVHKVIAPTRAVLANGGLLAQVGAHAIAVAAAAHSVPLVVVGGIYKLSPVWPRSAQPLDVLGGPADVIPFGKSNDLEGVHIVSPLVDYVPPELVTLFVTNIGGFNPTYVYRLLAEYYAPADAELPAP